MAGLLGARTAAAQSGSIRKAFQTSISLQRLLDRKSTRLNSSHLVISYAVFCLKKKNIRVKYPPYQLVCIMTSRRLHKHLDIALIILPDFDALIFLDVVELAVHLILLAVLLTI